MAVKRAEQALFDGRSQSAELYYQCALDVVRLRSACADNQTFDATYVMHPLKALIELAKRHQNFSAALTLLQNMEEEFRETRLVDPDQVQWIFDELNMDYRSQLAS